MGGNIFGAYIGPRRKRRGLCFSSMRTPTPVLSAAPRQPLRRSDMKPALFQLFLFILITVALAACDPAANVAADELASSTAQAAAQRDVPSDEKWTTEALTVPSAPASCPCFSRSALTNEDGTLSGSSASASDFYLYYDVFNYYGLDARRTEARALVSTPAGPLEEVASVYITYGSGPNDLHLICYRQEVVRDFGGAPTYRYETLAPSVEEAEACRRDIVAAVGEQEPCQGAACGVPYSKAQLSPDYPAYNDDFYRTPKHLLDAMREEVEEVQQMLHVPA